MAYWGAAQLCAGFEKMSEHAGAFAAASAMIAFGAVLGKSTPTQVLWLTFFMVGDLP